jgi:hypothetical protein
MAKPCTTVASGTVAHEKQTLPVHFRWPKQPPTERATVKGWECHILEREAHRSRAFDCR